MTDLSISKAGAGPATTGASHQEPPSSAGAQAVHDQTDHEVSHHRCVEAVVGRQATVRQLADQSREAEGGHPGGHLHDEVAPLGLGDQSGYVVDEALVDAEQVRLEPTAERVGVAEEQPGRRSVLLEELEGRPHGEGETGYQVPGGSAGQLLVDPLAESLLLQSHHGVKQLLFGGEIPVHRPVGQLGGLRRGVVALLGEHGLGCPEDLPPASLLLLLAHGARPAPSPPLCHLAHDSGFPISSYGTPGTGTGPGQATLPTAAGEKCDAPLRLHPRRGHYRPMDRSIEMLDPDAALAAAKDAGVPAPLAELNVFRALLRRPRLAKGLSQTLLALLGGDALDARRRELVIMRIAWVTGSGYEWAQHWRIARDLGVPEEDLVAVRDWVSASFDEVDRAVLGVTDVALAGGVPDARDLDAVRAALGDDALIDLLAAVGTWSAVSLLLRALEVPLDPDLQPWPPDGRPSPAA